MIRSTISDFLTKTSARVNTNHALRVASTRDTIPDVGTPNRFRYMNGLLGSEDLDTGITNMNVNGSGTPQTFQVKAKEKYDIHILGLLIIIADTAIVHNKFGNIPILTNGVNIVARESGIETNIVSAVKTGGQLIAQSGMFNAYGDAATSFELTNWTGTTDAQTIYIDIGRFVPDGIRLGRGTKDCIFLTVNDNLTGLTEFTVRILGNRQYV